jgi:hypothetical protein
MQEKLKIFSTNGEMLLERDLAGAVKPLMLLAGDAPQLVEAVPQGADVLGALVRDEDGWTLASAKDDMPVSSGPKTGTDFHLTAGVACALGPWVFRIEREGASTGSVLLWRVGSSAVAADPLIQGRNSIASAKDGAYAVNPAVAGAELCSIFPTTDGVDVTAADGAQRLSVPFATLFAVGPFQGMALPASDAAAAVKSGRPFGWPARSTRAGLMAMLLLVGLAALVALSFVKKKQSVDAVLAAKHGPELVSRTLYADDAKNTDEDALVYQNSFYRALPLILKASRSPITRDLLQRGRQVVGHVGGMNAKENEKLIGDILRFLKDVDDIQDAAQKGDWIALKDKLAAADRVMFTRCDADMFYEDAQEIVDFVTVALPKFFLSASEIGAAGFKDTEKQIQNYFDALKDNLFMSGDIVRRERDNAEMRWNALAAYVPARELFLASPESVGADLRDAWADLVDVFDPDDATFAPMLKRERERLVDAILKRAEKANSVELIHLSSLGEAVGVEDAQLAKWRARAASARRDMSKTYRDKYSDYRMRAAVAPDAPETLAVLDDMIALGLEDNSYHQWALREKARVQGKKGKSKENAKGDVKENAKGNVK